MSEVSGPVVAIALVLSAVFVPVAFMAASRAPLPAVRGHDRDLGLLSRSTRSRSARRCGHAAEAEGGVEVVPRPVLRLVQQIFGSSRAATRRSRRFLIRKSVRSLIFIGILIALTGGLVKSLRPASSPTRTTATS